MFKKNLILLFIITLLFPQTLYGQTASSVVQTAEAALGNLVISSKLLYQNKCNSDSLSCGDKIYDECSLYSPDLQCDLDFPQSTECSAAGGFMSWNDSAGRCSIELPCDTDEDRELICSQQDLFQKTELRHDVTSPIKYQYVGFYNSFRTIYPYQHVAFDDQGKCTEYDPRFRPWYVAACTGAKNIVIIMDISGSMKQLDRLAQAQEAAISVIQTLGQQDWFQVVFFNEQATIALSTSNSESLIQATEENRQQVIQRINEVNVGQLTNFEVAFNKAFEVFENTDAQEFGSHCGQNMILFLTDGAATKGKGSAENEDKGAANYEDLKKADEFLFLQDLETKNAALNAVIFTYSLGGESDERLPHQISCQHGGIWYSVPDFSYGAAGIRTKMRSYYTYLAKGLLNQDTVIWSEIYQDQITKLDFITAAKPIYVQNDSGYEILLGVAGVDLSVNEMKQYSDFDQILPTLLARTRSQCSTAQLDITECELDSLREKTCFAASPYVGGEDWTSKANQCTPIETAYSQCIEKADAQVWVNNEADKRYSAKNLNVCCPSDSGIMWFGIMAFVIVFVNVLMI